MEDYHINMRMMFPTGPCVLGGRVELLTGLRQELFLRAHYRPLIVLGPGRMYYVVVRTVVVL